MSRAKILGFLSAFAFAMGAASSAMAADDATIEAYPTEMTKRPIQLPEGMLEVRGDLGLNLSEGVAAKQIFVAPSANYGVTKDIQLGLQHGTSLGARSLCFGSACGKVYNGLDLDAKYWILRNEGFSLSAHLQVPVANLDPFVMGVRAGVYIWWYATQNLAIWADPALQIGIIGRDKAIYGKEILDIPIRVAYNVTPELAVFGDTGFNAVIDPPAPIGLGDTFRIPLGVGALYAINHKIDVGGEFSLPNMIAGTLYQGVTVAGTTVGAQDGFNSRYLGAFANLRF